MNEFRRNADINNLAPPWVARFAIGLLLIGLIAAGGAAFLVYGLS